MSAEASGRPRWLAPPLFAALGLAVFAFAGWAWTTSRASRAAPGPAAPLVHVELRLPDSLSLVSVGTAASLALSRDGSVLVFQGQREGEQPAPSPPKAGRVD